MLIFSKKREQISQAVEMRKNIVYNVYKSKKYLLHFMCWYEVIEYVNGKNKKIILFVLHCVYGNVIKAMWWIRKIKDIIDWRVRDDKDKYIKENI